MSETCSSCRYWKRLVHDCEDGQCRRHAPVVSKSDFGGDITRWPKSFDTDSCGDFVAIKEDVATTAARLAAELASGPGLNRDGLFVEGIGAPEQGDEVVQMLRDRPERRALLERMQSEPPVGAKQGA